MKALAIACLLALLAIIATPFYAAHAINKASESVVYISIETEQGQHGACSGEVIAHDRVLTAKHCVAAKMYVDGRLAKVQSVDDFYDLALLNVETHRPAITLRDTPVSRFEHLTGIGYAFGWSQLVALSTHVVLTNIIPFEGSAPGIILQGPMIGGMSGGPVVDWRGRMVSIVQQGAQGVSHGMNIAEIRVFLLTTDVR